MSADVGRGATFSRAHFFCLRASDIPLRFNHSACGYRFARRNLFWAWCVCVRWLSGSSKSQRRAVDTSKGQRKHLVLVQDTGLRVIYLQDIHARGFEGSAARFGRRLGGALDVWGFIQACRTLATMSWVCVCTVVFHGAFSFIKADTHLEKDT